MPFVFLWAVLFAGTSRAAGPVGPLPEVPTPAFILADLSFNFPNPPPLHVSTFGEHLLTGPLGRLRVDSALFPSPYLHASIVEVRDFFFGRVTASLGYEVVIVGPGEEVDVLFAAAGEVQGQAQSPPLGTGGAFVLISRAQRLPASKPRPRDRPKASAASLEHRPRRPSLRATSVAFTVAHIGEMESGHL
jgi:hypothetical protein